MLVPFILGMDSCVVPAGAAEAAEVKDQFEAKYAAWDAYRKADSPKGPTWSASAVFPAARVYDNEPFRQIVALGPQAVPFMIRKMGSDLQVAEALNRITKWTYHVGSSNRGPGNRSWVVAEFPDIVEERDRDAWIEVWARWWRENPKWTQERFAGLYAERAVLKQAGKNKEAQEKLQAIRDLGVAALPYMMEHVKAGEADLMPTISALTDGAVAAGAKPAACLAWWEANKEKWTIPFGSVKIEVEPAQAEKPAPRQARVPVPTKEEKLQQVKEAQARAAAHIEEAHRAETEKAAREETGAQAEADKQPPKEPAGQAEPGAK